jgi:hypothetical protein
MGKSLEGFFIAAGAVLFFVLGVAQLIAGYLGLEDSFGSGWAAAAIVLALMFQFTLPLVVGTYLCATEMLGWHWALGALVAMPGLLFMVPGLIAIAIDSVRRGRNHGAD